MSGFDRVTGTAVMRAAFESLDSLLVDLPPEAWAVPTCLPAWDVQANVAHLTGIEAMLLGEAEPSGDGDVETLPHVRNALGASNERWVQSLAAATPAEVLAEYRQRVAGRLAAIEAMTDADWDAEAMGPTGPTTYGGFMRIRTMDVWMHEQDIREAIGRPGHREGPVADAVLDQMVPALGFVVGKKAGAPDGTSVTFSLVPPGRDVHVAVEDGRARIVDSLPADDPPTVTLTMSGFAFTRVAGGRRPAADGEVAITGDEALGRQILANLAFMI